MMDRTAALIKKTAASTGLLELALKTKRSPPLILMYHGVTRDTGANGFRNSEGKHVPLDLFASHLRVLRRFRRVISLSELTDGLYDQRDLSNTVAITFDDGYENNALVAAPVLADFKMPAAFFLATGFIGAERCIWTDHLEKILDRTSCASLQLPDEADAMPIRSFDEKRRALIAAKALLKKKVHSSLPDAMEALAGQLGCMDVHADGDYRFMNWDQARGLVRAGFEVGAHTVSHPILTRLPLEEAANEILVSRDKVQQETGQCSSTFCFPNGKLIDFSPALKELCRQHFKSALSTERGVASLADIFELKRLSPAGTGRGENIKWMLLRAH
jgi:peptidoglycan/xylan/chitin deacetylase (PgdA/CDA1 family)